MCVYKVYRLVAINAKHILGTIYEHKIQKKSIKGVPKLREILYATSTYVAFHVHFRKGRSPFHILEATTYNNLRDTTVWQQCTRKP